MEVTAVAAFVFIKAALACGLAMLLQRGRLNALTEELIESHLEHRGPMVSLQMRLAMLNTPIGADYPRILAKLIRRGAVKKMPISPTLGDAYPNHIYYLPCQEDLAVSWATVNPEGVA